MDYIFQTGFLGTRAPLFMDIVSVIVAALPFLIYKSSWRGTGKALKKA